MASILSPKPRIEPATASPSSDDAFFAEIGKRAFALPLAILFVVPALLWQSYVLMVVWNWFIPEAFGLKGLTIGSAIAIKLVAAALRRPPSSQGETKASKTFIDPLLGPAMILGVAWLVRWAILAGHLPF